MLASKLYVDVPQRAGLRLAGVLGSAALAGLLFILTPAGARAARLGFRNDTTRTLIVQGISVINRVPRRDQVRILRPGDACWDVILVPGNKLIIISDAKQPIRTLYQDVVPCGAADVFLSITVEPRTGSRNKTQPQERVKLVPIKPKKK